MNDQLPAALSAEEAAIYAYGLIGVNLTAAGDVAEARTAEAAHRLLRDRLISRLSELSASAGPTPPAYDLPFPVTDRPSALKLAIHVEDGAAAIWRAVLPVTRDADRADALSALTESAVRATRWRRLAEVTPVTLPFPGKPGSS
jgi:ferritin-like protein